MTPEQYRQLYRRHCAATATDTISTSEEERLLALSPFAATLYKGLDPDGYQAALAVKRAENEFPGE